MKDISNKNEIEQYLHCGLCLKQLYATGEEKTPQEFSDLSVGFTDVGIQIWCNRHECNVAHIDFEDQTHPANTSAGSKILDLSGENENVIKSREEKTSKDSD